MNWLSWSDFWAMGGYGGYVWGAYGLTLVIMLGEPVLLRLRRRRVLERLAEAGEQRGNG
jgi:heme exporter protein D